MKTKELAKVLREKLCTKKNMFKYVVNNKCILIIWSKTLTPILKIGISDKITWVKIYDIESDFTVSKIIKLLKRYSNFVE